MNFRGRLCLIILIGLAIGFAARNSSQGDLNRVDAGLELFEKVCVTASRFDDKMLEAALLDLVPLGLRHNWADPKSFFLLELKTYKCSVSDVLLQMTAEERTQFEEKSSTFVNAKFPMLMQDKAHGLDWWELFELWAQFEVGDDRRWGVSLSRYSDIEGGVEDLFATSSTSLIVNFPVK